MSGNGHVALISIFDRHGLRRPGWDDFTVVVTSGELV
jgi:hypothetical protein